ncbi:caspase, EACC1-associated type [Streptomyces cavernicola]|uniref:Esterase-like activity of phytase family protein n=1 Tax=Streptomyces cavernicola TaxID=3043613 RepID=A0ABT6SGB6_9ACTN|nr:esterase-like activity of phytase family protein [Streptomyces sp. B-S-A6]MDI3407252.1 esterase-like activity of phytase family protein [Streptomyces sp. B-S-A6]
MSTVDPAGRIDPKNSVCVLIGVSEYTYLNRLPSVTNNLTELRAVLTDKTVWGIPDDSKSIVSVPNPKDSAALIRPIIQAAKRAKDTLIVYYAGHGVVDREDQELYLTLPDSVAEESYASVHSKYIRQAMRDHGSARRRVLLLDCCYSGRFLEDTLSGAELGPKAAVETLTPPDDNVSDGSYVMTSAPRNRLSHAPHPESCTAFTEALVKVMRGGISNGPEMLGLDALFKQVKVELEALRPRIHQEPQSRAVNGVGGLDFVRNAALPPSPERDDPGPEQPRRPRLRWLFTAGAAGLALGLGVGPALAMWEKWNPEPAGGACSEGATLLDYSDALDKVEVDNENVSGLSGITLLPGSSDEALAIADNEPGRVFPLNLGAATELKPEVDTGTTLSDGKNIYDPPFDGEALVVEQGGKTMLVASETGPAIRRFDVDSGDQMGDELPLPDAFREWPKGGAQEGRTIESLAVSPDGSYLYVALEAPLAQDGDDRGNNLMRIQRYKGSPGKSYKPDRQYPLRMPAGLNLVDLVAVGENRLLALQRAYTEGIGNAVHVTDLKLDGAQDVTDEESIYPLTADHFIASKQLFDLRDCPAGGEGVVDAKSAQVNPLLGNVEGMALGPRWKTGQYEGRYPLYLVSDDNDSKHQITRLYAFAVRLQ